VTKLAVMYVHGVEIADSRFAETSIALLREEFGRIAGVDPDEALSIRTAFWAPVYEGRQTVLLNRMGGARAKKVFGLLDALGGAADRGSVAALLGLAATGLVRSLPGNPGFHFPTLRWLIVHYLGDAITYQAGAVDRELYDDVHRVLAAALHDLAVDAGPAAPLCVVAHSLGSVVTSNFFYDLQVAGGLHESRSAGLAPRVAAELDDTPLERGETLAWLHTLGSPLALWAQRHPDFGVPITVPHPALADLHPRAGGEWINSWDPDDVIASPLRRLNDRYAAAVAEDRPVAVAPWWLGWTPLAHPFYWNDRRVMTPIASGLAQAWHRLRVTTG
jgi:alpha-beta hydrolase superfamily lysophospholipase